MSDKQEPVAWHVRCDSYEAVTLLREHADAIAEPYGVTPIPLFYGMTLTAAEREAVGVFSRIATDPHGHALRGLLARTAKEGGR
jgi:hypothetical protein